MSLRENIWKDTVTRLEIKEPLGVSKSTSLRMTIAAMRQACSGCVLVSEGLALCGIFTERDLVKRVLVTGANLDSPVSEFMTARPVTVRQSDSVGWVIRTMVEGHYRHLPVVDEFGEPIGIVSAKAVVQYLVDHVPVAVYNLPPRPGRVEQAREGA
ncbi:MAG TPA: CBS domain-containing protein [Phycisphaerae bacterium]|nr:CBS domain-containing protein [Phycisphaerae bacterium]